MSEKRRALAKCIEKALVLSVMESCYEGQMFPAVANPISEDDKALIVSTLRSPVPTGATREATEAQLDAARDWSREKYGKPVGNDGATGCWQAMLDAYSVSSTYRGDAKYYNAVGEPSKVEPFGDAPVSSKLRGGQHD